VQMHPVLLALVLVVFLDAGGAVPVLGTESAILDPVELIQRPSELPTPGSKPASMVKLAREVSSAKQAVQQAFSETTDDEARERHVMNNFRHDLHSQKTAKALLNHLSKQIRVALPAVDGKMLTKVAGPEQTEGAGVFPSKFLPPVVKAKAKAGETPSQKEQLVQKRKDDSQAPEQAEGAGQFRPIPAVEVAAYRASLHKELDSAERYLKEGEQHLARDQRSEVTAENTERVDMALTQSEEHTKMDTSNFVQQEKARRSQDVHNDQLLQEALQDVKTLPVAMLPSSNAVHDKLAAIEKDKDALSSSLAAMARLSKLGQKLGQSYRDLKHEDLVLHKRSIQEGAEREAVSELHIATPTSGTRKKDSSHTNATIGHTKSSHDAHGTKHEKPKPAAKPTQQKPPVTSKTTNRKELAKQSESSAEDTVAWAAKQEEVRRVNEEQAQIEADAKLKQHAKQGAHKVSSKEAEASAERVVADEKASQSHTANTAHAQAGQAKPKSQKVAEAMVRAAKAQAAAEAVNAKRSAQAKPASAHSSQPAAAAAATHNSKPAAAAHSSKSAAAAHSSKPAAAAHSSKPAAAAAAHSSKSAAAANSSKSAAATHSSKSAAATHSSKPAAAANSSKSAAATHSSKPAAATHNSKLAAAHSSKPAATQSSKPAAAAHSSKPAAAAHSSKGHSSKSVATHSSKQTHSSASPRTVFTKASPAVPTKKVVTKAIAPTSRSKASNTGTKATTNKATTEKLVQEIRTADTKFLTSVAHSDKDFTHLAETGLNPYSKESQSVLAQYLEHEKTAAVNVLKKEFGATQAESNKSPSARGSQDLGGSSSDESSEVSQKKGVEQFLAKLKTSLKQPHSSNMKHVVATSKAFAKKLSKQGKELEAAEVLAEVMKVEKKMLEMQHDAQAQPTVAAPLHVQAKKSVKTADHEPGQHTVVHLKSRVPSTARRTQKGAVQSASKQRHPNLQVTSKRSAIHKSAQHSAAHVRANAIEQQKAAPSSKSHQATTNSFTSKAIGHARPESSAQAMQDFFLKQAANEEHLLDVGHQNLASKASESGKELQGAVTKYMKGSQNNAFALVKQELDQGVDKLKAIVSPSNFEKINKN